MHVLLSVFAVFFSSISVAQPIKGHIGNSGVLNEKSVTDNSTLPDEKSTDFTEQSIYHYCAEFYMTNYRECNNYLLGMPHKKANQIMSEYRLERSSSLISSYDVGSYLVAVAPQKPGKNVSRAEESPLPLWTVSSFVIPIGITTIIAGATILTLELTSFPKNSEAAKMQQSLKRLDSNFTLSGSLLVFGAVTSTIGIVLSSSQE